MVAYTINISTTEAEAVGSLEFEANLNIERISGQPGIHSETLFHRRTPSTLLC